MRILLLENNELVEMDIEITLENLQKLVGGLIEYPYVNKILSENQIDLICNEEGKFIAGFNPEIVLVDRRGNIQDVIMGNCVFVGSNAEGENIGLTEKQVGIIHRICTKNAILSFNNSSCTVRIIEMDGE